MPPDPHRDRLQRRCSSDGGPTHTSDEPCTPDASLPSRLRAFHERLPLAGDPPNAVLSLPDDRLLYLVPILRDTPQPAPALSSSGVMNDPRDRN